MIKLLRAIVTFLETRFPEKVVVTRADYEILKARVGNLSEDRIKRVEDQIEKLNIAMGLASGRMPFQR
jgi:hypothetical protein